MIYDISWEVWEVKKRRMVCKGYYRKKKKKLREHPRGWERTQPLILDSFVFKVTHRVGESGDPRPTHRFRAWITCEWSLYLRVRTGLVHKFQKVIYTFWGVFITFITDVSAFWRLQSYGVQIRKRGGCLVELTSTTSRAWSRTSSVKLLSLLMKAFYGTTVGHVPPPPDRIMV